MTRIGGASTSTGRPAPRRPDAVEQHLHRPEVALLRLVERDFDQLRPRFGGEQIERCDPFAGAWPPRPAGVALGEAAIGLTKIGEGIRRTW